MVIDAGDDHAVVWTKPDDWEVEPDMNAEGVFTSHPDGGTNVLFADGWVRFITRRIKPAVLRALLTRAGGEVIDRDEM